MPLVGLEFGPVFGTYVELRRRGDNVSGSKRADEFATIAGRCWHGAEALFKALVELLAQVVMQSSSHDASQVREMWKTP